MAGSKMPGRGKHQLELLVRPGLKRVLDYFAYAISGLALVGGVTYGLQHLPQRWSAAPVAAPAPSAAQASTAADSSNAATAEASPPDQGADQASQAAAGLPVNQSPASQDPTQAEPVDANGQTAEQAAFSRDQATYYALQRNCYEAANNNQNGEYPALQASACNRYAQFAYARGWSAGTLPAYGQAAQQAPAAADSAAAAQPDLSDQSQAQFQTPPQVIILDQSFNGNRQGDGHRPYGQNGGNNTQPPRQTGPNYSLPPLQQPPEVFQPHRSEPSHGRPPPGQSR